MRYDESKNDVNWCIALSKLISIERQSFKIWIIEWIILIISFDYFSFFFHPFYTCHRRNLIYRKVPLKQNWSKFSFLFIYIWFDRAWKADHEYILFISIWSFFGWENLKKLERLKKCCFYVKIKFFTKTTKFLFQLFSEHF